MYTAKEEIESHIEPTHNVLDLGSWNDVFPRANFIIDVNPYETRKNRYSGEREHFTRDTWLQADVNKIETWNRFKDHEFDFVICSHLLEDIRDPLFVCQQMMRVAKAGYIEVPTRFRECSRASVEDSVSGYDHHRWLVDIIDGSLVFTAKLHWAHTLDYLTEEKRNYLHFHNFHYFGAFWSNSFHFYERCPKGELLEGANLLYLFENLDLSQLKDLNELPRDVKSVSPGSLLWWDQFSLPLEDQGPPVKKGYGNLSLSTDLSLVEKNNNNDVVTMYLHKYIEQCQSAKKMHRSQVLEIAGLIESLDEKNNQLKSAYQEVASLSSTLAAFLESTSWRITAPIRQVLTVLKKAFLK
jgi:SAM-dependent methyltransferase